jgi:acyl-CoA reductase-like NAD-dependent aldehyde dehydrogenase
MKFRSVNPHNNEVIKEYAFITNEEVKTKLDASYDAFKKHRKLSLEDRIAKAKKLKELFEEYSDKLAEAESNDMGKPIAQAKGEVAFACMSIQATIDKAPEFMKNEVVEMESKKAYIHYEPLGPLFVVLPWNFPIVLTIDNAIPQLVAGNTILIKQAPSCPTLALLLEELFHKA